MQEENDVNANETNDSSNNNNNDSSSDNNNSAAASDNLEATEAMTMWSSVTAAGVENGPAPPSRSKHSATLLAGYVYLLGGRNGNLPLKDLWRYNLGKYTF